MRFSVFLTARSTRPAEDRPVMLEMAEHAVRAEELGFAAVFLPDHHFTGYAPPASEPMMFAAYLAAKLQRAYLGFSVQTVPLHHPVRFAERLALLDQLTTGKMLVGVGSGTTPEESIGFGVNFKDTSRISQENLAIVEQLWAKQPDDDPVVFDTGHYKGAVVSRIVPEPYTKPEPRMMSVAMRPASIERAAIKAQPAFIPAFTPPDLGPMNPFEHFARYFTAYRSALEAAGHPDEVVRDCLSWTTHTYQFVHVADSDERAREELEYILGRYQECIDREHVANKRAEQISDVDIAPAPDARNEGFIRTWCLYGSPDTVAEKLRPYADLGVGNVLFSFTGGPLDERRRKLTEQAMTLFAAEVMPRFR
jgi:alkanesulfonate monooxygenase SsuD/methylene tetrahydromethanopterin reductase-like flavin-dependent oxidoreductase (luciferase family)